MSGASSPSEFRYGHHGLRTFSTPESFPRNAPNASADYAAARTNGGIGAPMASAVARSSSIS
jgi:hypothetical protein